MTPSTYPFVIILILFGCIHATAQDSRCSSPTPTPPEVEAFEAWLQGYLATSKPASTEADEIYILPVIFHIIHDSEDIGTGLNLSDSQIFSQLAATNRDFRMQNWDTVNTLPEFKAVAADLGIELALAVHDPDGNELEVPGINRIDRTAAGFTPPPYSVSYSTFTIKPTTYWDPERYVNVWVSDFEVLGHSPFPSAPHADLPSPPAPYQDGVLVDYQSFGTFGNIKSKYNHGRSLTHELGHWLGLYHIWGTATECGSSDYCADTPEQEKEIYHCPDVSSSCGSNDMYQNYMGYVDDACMTLFTEDQKQRIRAVVEAAPRRKELLTSPVPTVVLGLEDMITQSFSIRHIDIGLEVETRHHECYDIQIYNSTGRVIQSIQSCSPRTHIIDLQSVPSQVIVIRVITRQGAYSKKVMTR